MYGKPKPKPTMGVVPPKRPGSAPSSTAPAKRPMPTMSTQGPPRNMTEMLPTKSAGAAKPAGATSTTKKVKSFMKKYGQA